MRGLKYLILLCCMGCLSPKPEAPDFQPYSKSNPYLMVLGIAQDAGFPQADCRKSCCTQVWNDPAMRKSVSCLALIDPSLGKGWLFDATPDFKDQLNRMQKSCAGKDIELSGIFLTHAHMGHYTGLMNLGREAMGGKSVPVHAMPRMQEFLRSNGPWSQLVDLQNIDLKAMRSDSIIQLTEQLSVIPIEVPHRDEFSETVGFMINAGEKRALFIPDIDKWGKWQRDINFYVKQVDYAFLDGTFYQNGEIPGRDMQLIPHPFLEESLERFKSLRPEEKDRIHFIHFNHTNPVLQANSAATAEIEAAGFHIAEENTFFEL